MKKLNKNPVNTKRTVETMVACECPCGCTIHTAPMYNTNGTGFTGKQANTIGIGLCIM